MAKLETPHGCIAYESVGDGPPLVILRGLGRCMRHWLGYDQELARHYRVICMDLRGIGLSTRRLGWLTTIEEMADDVVSVLDHLKVPAAHIMGVSLGGMVTLGTGLRHPERARSLVTINTSIGGQRLLRLSLPASLFLGRQVFTGGRDVERGLARLLLGDECTPERLAEVIEAHEGILREQGLVVTPVIQQLLAALRFRPAARLAQMKIPTLIVYGTRDRFVPNSNSVNLSRLVPGAKLVAIKGAGHEIPLDKGKELLAVLRDWTQAHQWVAAAT